MNNNYSISEVNEVDRLLDYLLTQYTNDPYYLKQTLREIRSLVHQANLQADELIQADWFKSFNSDDTLSLLKEEFPNLTWSVKQVREGYSFEGQLNQLNVSVDYKVSLISSLFKEEQLEPYWEVDIYLDCSDWVISLNKNKSRLVSLEVAIHSIKDSLLPVKEVFGNLELKETIYELPN